MTLRLKNSTFCRQSGIRTHGAIRTSVFKTGALNHSAIHLILIYTHHEGLEPSTDSLEGYCSSNWAKDVSP